MEHRDQITENHTEHMQQSYAPFFVPGGERTVLKGCCIIGRVVEGRLYIRIC